MRRILGIFALCGAFWAALAQCGRQDQVTVELDDALTDFRKAEVRRAADKWKTVADLEIAFEPRGDYLIVPAYVPGGWYGYTQHGRHLVRISPATPNDQVYAVALHELGHVLGLEHTSHGVMDPNHQTVEFSVEDLIECKRAGACPNDRVIE